VGPPYNPKRMIVTLTVYAMNRKESRSCETSNLVTRIDTSPHLKPVTTTTFGLKISRVNKKHMVGKCAIPTEESSWRDLGRDMGSRVVLNWRFQ
jgi:hypothetical protein